MVVDMGSDMEEGKALEADKALERTAQLQVFRKVLEDRVLEGRALRMERDMVEDMEEGISFCRALDRWAYKVEDIQACKAEDIRACKARKSARKALGMHRRNGWNSPSKKASKRSKKATRPIFPVVFSLKDSLLRSGLHKVLMVLIRSRRGSMGDFAVG